MNTPAQIAANMRSAQNLALRQLGLDISVNTAALTYGQRIAYNKALATIVAKYPERFNTGINAAAAVVAKKNYEPLTSPDVANAVKEFVSEAAKVGAGIHDKLNPFSGSNIGLLKWLLILGGIAAAVYVVGPSLGLARKSLTRRAVRVSRS